ncbi:hypothetical protein EYC84_004694 [Monilinia fructicola]|uniref:YDG domain-containing protein n=1 Tax=Monilinia fructicola TaxID=38448 RepID=A0A5M9K4E9_MONFR|nr:hypothetical protein EYC84_004694 [Monilinia fructicola]
MINQNPQVDVDAVNQLNLPAAETLKLEYEKGYMYRGIRYSRKVPLYRKTWVQDQRSKWAEGHNGHLIGQWWPERLCALRDRAHGELQRGICGQTGVGAVSIYMGTGYENRDNGDEIEYCGDGGDGLTLMDLSLERGTLIRVLRAADAGSAWAPAVGVRYDGLYKIVGKEEMAKEEGKKQNYRYKLLRCENQKPFPFQGEDSRPTMEEKAEFMEMKPWEAHRH